MWLNGWIRKIFGYENFYCIILKLNSILYIYVFKRDRLYKWIFVVIIYLYEDDIICMIFFYMESNFKNLYIYIYIRFFVYIIYILKFCINFGKFLSRVFINK